MTLDTPPPPGPSPTSQEGFAYRFDWGCDGLHALAPGADVVVVVDVLSFTTAVDVAVGRGAAVLPYPWADGGAPAHAAAHRAVLARGRAEASAGEPWSLSPASLAGLPRGARLVLPSPNGSALAFAAAGIGPAGGFEPPTVIAGCLRNAAAVAATAGRLAGPGGVIVVLGAGERWPGAAGSLRPAVEDLLGAGAVLSALDPSASVSLPRCSPEAAAARAAFLQARPRLAEALRDCGSGRELVAAGFGADIDLAAALDVSTSVPVLRDGAFVSAALA